MQVSQLKNILRRLLNGQLLACFFDGDFEAGAALWVDTVLNLLEPGDAENEKLSVAITLLVWTLVGPSLLLADMPLGLNLLRGLLDVVLLWRILPALVTPAESRPLTGLLVLAVGLLATVSLLGNDWYGRVLTVALGLGALVTFRVLGRAQSTAGSPHYF